MTDSEEKQLIFARPGATSIRLSLTLVVGAVGLAACGGGNSSATPGPSDSGGGSSTGTTITITSTGVSPKTVAVTPGSQVTMINRDSVEHQMFSDPHPDHTDCPELNAIGFLAPGATRQTANLTVLRTCGFHDHERPTESRLQGSVTVR